LRPRSDSKSSEQSAAFGCLTQLQACTRLQPGDGRHNSPTTDGRAALVNGRPLCTVLYSIVRTVFPFPVLCHIIAKNRSEEWSALSPNLRLRPRIAYRVLVWLHLALEKVSVPGQVTCCEKTDFTVGQDVTARPCVTILYQYNITSRPRR
jgi:hypothetical protein